MIIVNLFEYGLLSFQDDFAINEKHAYIWSCSHEHFSISLGFQ